MDLNEAKIEGKNYEEEDYNMNVEQVFDDDDDDNDNDQWEKLEHTGNLPVRQE